jgi:mono/diheme cytochrome c family protein
MFSIFKKLVLINLGIACLFSSLSCQKSSVEILPMSPLASRGKAIYLSNCIACHNPTPTLDGSIGPNIAFSSLELLNAKLVTNTYPLGYKPKRSSGAMPEFSHLKEEIPALHAYLNAFKK